MNSRPTLALAAAFAALAAGCASAGGSAAAGTPVPAACAASAIGDAASLGAAFDSLHALAVRGHDAEGLVLAPYDAKPQVANGREVQRLFGDLFPAALRDAGAGGGNEVAMLIGASGTVRNAALVRGSGRDDLDRATLALVRGMRFLPARRGSCPVPFFSAIPINWKREAAR